MWSYRASALDGILKTIFPHEEGGLQIQGELLYSCVDFYNPTNQLYPSGQNPELSQRPFDEVTQTWVQLLTKTFKALYNLTSAFSSLNI